MFGTNTHVQRILVRWTIGDGHLQNRLVKRLPNLRCTVLTGDFTNVPISAVLWPTYFANDRCDIGDVFFEDSHFDDFQDY